MDPLKIRKWVQELTKQDWVDITRCDSNNFIKAECNRIFSDKVDYYNGTMITSKEDQHFGDPIDCLAFAKRYQVVVVICACDINAKQCSTFVFDGRLDQHSTVHHHPGICPTVCQSPLMFWSWYNIERI
jgi:hypothetical protein